MARISSITIENYRSIRGPLSISFPEDSPIILIGENNSGKSNLVKALDLVLGQFWPGNHEPDDHEFFGRTRTAPFSISVDFDPDDAFGRGYESIVLRHDPAVDETWFRGAPDRRGGAEGYISNRDRDTCICVTIQAERNLDYHLSYRSKYTFLSRLMHRFHKELARQEDVRDELLALFDQVKRRFNELPYFAEFTELLKSQLGTLVGPMTHRLEVDFEAYNPVNFFHALRLQALEGDVARTLDEMGTGEQQVLALSFAYAFAEAFHGGIVLVIEEPEAHLHPLAQEWLAARLSDMCTGGLQVVMTTHSPHFVDIMNVEGLVLVRRTGPETTVLQLARDDLVSHCRELGVPAERITGHNVLPFYRANATPEILEGFFAKLVVLVEGPTESLALPVYLEKCGLNTASHGIAVVPVMGKGNLAKWHRLFSAYQFPTYIIFDNDTRDDEAGTKRRDALLAVGVIDEAEQDALVTAEDWIISDAYSVFGSDFERTLRDRLRGYSELEQEGQDQGVESKVFLARFVAERIDREPGEVGWVDFDDLTGRLRQLV